MNANWQRSSHCSNSTCIEVKRQGREVLLRDSKLEPSPILRYTQEEFAAFIAGIRAGEFDTL